MSASDSNIYYQITTNYETAVGNFTPFNIWKICENCQIDFMFLTQLLPSTELNLNVEHDKFTKYSRRARIAKY